MPPRRSQSVPDVDAVGDVVVVSLRFLRPQSWGESNGLIEEPHEAAEVDTFSGRSSDRPFCVWVFGGQASRPRPFGKSARLGHAQRHGGVAKLADAGDLKSSTERFAGSSPAAPTIS